MTRTLKLTLFLSLITSACVDDATEVGTPTEPLPDEVTWREHTYERADGFAPSSLIAETSSLAGKSREELAELLRVTILHPNGGVYTMKEPNWDAADATLAPPVTIHRDPKEDAVRAHRPREPLAIGGVFEPGVTTDPVPAIIGSDNRTLSPHLSNPYNAIARVDVFTSGAGSFRTSCTGSWIGPWTFVLAGHCMRFTDGAIARRVVIETARSGSSLPFGRLDCNNADSATANNFVAAVPSGYSGTVENALDFAVIDVYPCAGSARPASRTFNGYTVNSGTTTYNMHGYPIGRCPSASTEGTFMCGMAGEGYVNDWRLESQLDGTPGQDGAPWFTLDPTRVAGVHVGYREYGDFGRCGFDPCRRQYARRIDGTMDSFIRDISYDF